VTSEKRTRNLFLLELMMFTVHAIYSSINLYFDASAFFAIIKEGNNVVFDSFNFFYRIVLFPVNAILVITSLILMTAIFKKAKDKRFQAILPNALILANFILNVSFHPGLKDIKRFNVSFIKDDAILLAILCISIYSIISQIKTYISTP
jgi:hypothetical protein